MGIFKRSTRADVSGPDATFPFLTADRASRVRVLAQQAFAEIGVEVVPKADCMTASDGTVYGLANLMATCHNSPDGEKSWPTLVQKHCRTIVTAMQQRIDIAAMPLDQVLSRVYLRVMGMATVPPEALGWFTYAEPVCGDILEVLALDSPESVATLRDQDVSAVDLATLKRAGLENLLREPVDVVEKLNVDTEADLFVVMGESVYTASRILVLPDLLPRVFGDRTYPDGVLVAAPFRHQVVLHPVDGKGIVAATTAMAQFAQLGFNDSACPVSPFTYWWKDGAFTQLSHLDEDGSLVIRAEGEFAEAVTRLTQ